jgi:hypothetical protein
VAAYVIRPSFAADVLFAGRLRIPSLESRRRAQRVDALFRQHHPKEKTMKNRIATLAVLTLIVAPALAAARPVAWPPGPSLWETLMRFLGC